MQAKQHIQLNTTQSIQPLLAKFGIETADIMVESLVLDSREVAIHSAFIALKGHVRDGRDFIPQGSLISTTTASCGSETGATPAKILTYSSP